MWQCLKRSCNWLTWWSARHPYLCIARLIFLFRGKSVDCTETMDEFSRPLKHLWLASQKVSQHRVGGVGYKKDMEPQNLKNLQFKRHKSPNITATCNIGRSNGWKSGIFPASAAFSPPLRSLTPPFLHFQLLFLFVRLLLKRIGNGYTRHFVQGFGRHGSTWLVECQRGVEGNAQSY